MKAPFPFIAALVLAAPVAAQGPAPVSPDQFAAATAVCVKTLAVDGPAKVLTTIEADGWTLRKTTAIGGVFAQAGNAIELKVETVFGSRICTILGNRDPALPLADLTASIAAKAPGKVTREPAGSGTSLVFDDKYRTSITPAQADKRFNTQITAIEK